MIKTLTGSGSLHLVLRCFQKYKWSCWWFNQTLGFLLECPSFLNPMKKTHICKSVWSKIAVVLESEDFMSDVCYSYYSLCDLTSNSWLCTYKIAIMPCCIYIMGFFWEPSKIIFLTTLVRLQNLCEM